MTEHTTYSKIIPSVENHLFGDSKEDLEAADRMLEGMLSTVNVRDRIEAARKIASWCPFCDAEILQRITENGIADPSARVTVRDYLVFKRVLAKKMEDVKQQLEELRKASSTLIPLFDRLLTEKHGFKRYTE